MEMTRHMLIANAVVSAAAIRYMLTVVDVSSSSYVYLGVLLGGVLLMLFSTTNKVYTLSGTPLSITAFCVIAVLSAFGLHALGLEQWIRDGFTGVLTSVGMFLCLDIARKSRR